VRSKAGFSFHACRFKNRFEFEKVRGETANTRDSIMNPEPASLGLLVDGRRRGLQIFQSLLAFIVAGLTLLTFGGCGLVEILCVMWCLLINNARRSLLKVHIP
jgi:hypothetical protein